MENSIPGIPIEIITEILSNLGKNDLLKCRLVSQSWNGLALKILRNPKYGHEHELTQDNIPKFLEYFEDRNEEWVLPFHLKINRDEDDTIDYHLIPMYIQHLQVVFGGKCVSGLTLTHDYHLTVEAVEELISILTRIAPSLTHLDLSRFHVAYYGHYGEEMKMKVEEMLGNTHLNFPNLSKFKSCPAPVLSLGRNEKNNKIHTFLIEKSKNLKDLEVFSPYGILPIEQIGNLRKLKIVDELHDLVNILEPIRIRMCSTPVLKDLSLFCSSRLSVLDYQVLYDFLSSLSTSMQSLMVKFEEIPTNPFPRLSQLKFLAIQVSCSNPIRARPSVDPETLNLNSEAFPVLESMDISANLYLESTDADSGITKGDWNLRTVKNLRIKVMNTSFNANAWDKDRVDYYSGDSDSDSDPENPDPPGQHENENANISIPSVKDYVDQLQKLFPNMTSLTLVNENEGFEDEDNEEYLIELLTAFIQSDGATKIQELEIQDYDKNYLGYILTLNGSNPDRGEPRVIIENINLDEKFLKAIKEAVQGFAGGSDLIVDKQMETRDGVENSVITCKAPIIDLKMTGLEKIRLSLLKKLKPKSRQWGSEQESNRKDLFHMSLPKHLPLLRQIDISQRMFGDEKELCKDEIINVQEKFPDLIINLLATNLKFPGNHNRPNNFC